MTEYELLVLIASGTDQMADIFSLYLTVLSAYLLVAYSAGSKLTALQFGGLTGLFLFASSGQALGIYQNDVHIGGLYQSKQQLSALTPYESQYVANTNVWVVAMVVAIVISIFFMRQARQVKAE